MAISVDNRHFSYPCVFNAPAQRGSPWNWVSAQGSEETRMMGLPEGQPFWYNTGVWRIATQPRRRSKYALSISASRSKNYNKIRSYNNVTQSSCITAVHYQRRNKINGIAYTFRDEVNDAAIKPFWACRDNMDSWRTRSATFAASVEPDYALLAKWHYLSRQ